MKWSANYGFFHSGALLQAVARMSFSTRSDLVNKVMIGSENEIEVLCRFAGMQVILN